MHKITFRIRPRGLESQFHDEVGSDFDLARDLTVTDRVEVAGTSSEPVAFVATNLPDVMQVLCQSNGHSILRPDEVTPERIRFIANGSLVFSQFKPQDLQLDRETWSLVGYLAHGHTQGQACELAAYSLRTAQRRLRRLMRKSRVPDAFSWTLLRPIFPGVEELEL